MNTPYHLRPLAATPMAKPIAAALALAAAVSLSGCGPDTQAKAPDAAAAGGRMGEVVVLAATGMQGGWSSVPPAHLYHIIAGLTRVGRSFEARLIAAEAVTRSEGA